MTSSELRQIAGGLVRVRMDDLHDAFQPHLRTIIELGSQRGLIGSSILRHQLLDAYAKEIRARALETWSILHRAISTAGIPIYDDPAIPLKGFVIEFLSPELERLRSALDGDLNRYGYTTGQREQFDVAVDRALALVRSEIELYLISLERQAPHAPSIQHIYNAPVGAVQTGGGAVAYVTQGLDAASVERLRQALLQVRNDVTRLESAEMPQRAEVLELVSAAEKEIASSEPRRVTLTAFLSEICTGIQTLPNAAPAYQTLRAIAAQIGIPLP